MLEKTFEKNHDLMLTGSEFNLSGVRYQAAGLGSVHYDDAVILRGGKGGGSGGQGHPQQDGAG